MKVLKTIVATAVIVFALTTVAMAGVQHLNGRDDAPKADRQAQKTAKATYTLHLTDRQLDRLAVALAKDHIAKAKHTAKHTAQHDRTATHASGHTAQHQETTRHTQSPVSSASGSLGTHHAEPAYTGTHHGSGSASGGTSTGGTTGGSGHHDGGHSGGHD